MTKQKEKEGGNKRGVNKGGRPKIEFDLNQVETLGKIQCTIEELAAVLGVSVDTIDRRIKEDEAFSGAYKKGRETGKASLRRKQWELALAGNVTMNIWLGKQYLGQSDKQEIGGIDGSDIKIQASFVEKEKDDKS